MLFKTHPRKIALLTVLTLSGCSTSTTAPLPSSFQHSYDGVNCLDLRDTSANIICGEIKKNGYALTAKGGLEKQPTAAIEKILAKAGITPNSSASFTYTAYENVLQEHMPEYIKNTQQCRTDIANVVMNDCRRQECLDQCKQEASQTKHLINRQQKKAQRCENGKVSSCIVNCEFAKNSDCRARCSRDKNPSWRTQCQSQHLNNAQSNEAIDRHQNQCQLQCRKDFTASDAY